MERLRKKNSKNLLKDSKDPVEGGLNIVRPCKENANQTSFGVN